MAIFVAHAERCWRAEEANATRITSRANLVLSAATAIIGFKLFAIGKEMKTILAIEGDWRLWVFLASTIAGGTCLITSLWNVFEPRFRAVGKPPASGGLHLDDRAVTAPWTVPPEYAAPYIFLLTYRAATDLYERNQRREKAVEVAQKWLLVGFGLVIISFILYHALDFTATMPQDNAGGDQ